MLRRKPKWTLEAALADRWKFYEASGRGAFALHRSRVLSMNEQQLRQATYCARCAGKKDKAFPDDDLILAAAAKK